MCIVNNNYKKKSVKKTIDLYNLFELDENKQLNKM